VAHLRRDDRAAEHAARVLAQLAAADPELLDLHAPGAGQVGGGRRVAGEQVLRTVRLDPPGGERELALEEVAAEPRAAQAAWFLGLLEPELDAAHRDAHDQRIAPDHPDREVLVAVVDVAAVLAAVHAEEERHAAELAEVRLDPEPGVRLRR